MKLTEIAKGMPPKDQDPLRDQRYAWLKKHWASHISTIPSKSTFSVDSGKLEYPGKNIIKLDGMFEEIPFPFGVIDSMEIIAKTDDPDLSSLKNFPEHVSSLTFTGKDLDKTPIWKFKDFGELQFDECDSFHVAGVVKSYQGMPRCRMLGIHNSKLTSIKELCKHIKAKEVEFTGNTSLFDLLELLKVPGLEEVNYYGFGNIDRDGPITDAFEIINKYIGKGNAGIVKAQRELIEHDLEDFA